MQTQLKILFYKSIQLLFAIGLLAQCSSDDEMYEDFVSDNLTNTIVIDTVSIKSYTTKFDSVVTSSTGEVLVGSYIKDKVGSYTATSYLEFSLPTNIENLDFDDSYRFDSIEFVTVFNSYVGDTSQQQRIEIRQLTEELTPPDEDDIYMLNINHINYEDKAIGEGSFFAKPTANEEASIRLSDSFGQTFFDMIKDEAEEFELEEDFQEFFRGIALVPATGTGNAILGFSTGGSSTDSESNATVAIRLHYTIVSEFPLRDSIDFPLSSSTYHYTEIDFEAENPLIASIKSEEDKVAASDTNDETIISGGIGLTTRIEFPYLQVLRENIGEQGYILGAKLIVQPLKNTYRYRSDLPASLEMYQVNGDNEIIDQVYEPYTSDPQYGEYYYDGEFYEDTQYAFDLTEYFTETGIYEEGEGFLLTVPLSSLTSNFKSVVFPAPNTQSENSNVYLELYYIYVDP